MASGGSKGSPREGVNLPLARVRTIMKSSPDTASISQAALQIVAKAAELFIQHLSKEVLEETKDKKPKELSYNALADFIQEDSSLEFLRDIVPKKIKVKDYYTVMKDADQEDY